MNKKNLDSAQMDAFWGTCADNVTQLGDRLRLDLWRAITHDFPLQHELEKVKMTIGMRLLDQ